MRKTKKRSNTGILNKKLCDFESELNALAESNEFVVPNSMHQKLAFLKNILLAEIASDPGHALPRSHHRRLAHIVDRIHCLEAILVDPDGLVAGMAANSSITTVQKNDIDVGGGVDTDGIVGGDTDSDDGSTCSCTESCLNDDGEENDEEKPEDTEEVGLILYDNPVFQTKNSVMIKPKDDKDEKKGDEDDDEAEEEKVMAALDGRFWRGVASGAVVTATIMGTVIMVLLGDTFVDQSHFSLPPT